MRNNLRGFISWHKALFKKVSIGTMNQLLFVVNWLSGEWMLRDRSNSGSIIFLRSVLVSTYIFSFGLCLKCLFDPDTSMQFSMYEFRSEIRDNIAWFGAVFAASYAGFYARYSAQWGYLAGLYNQIMATGSTLAEENLENQVFLYWKAAFIEDCFHLHLDRKEIFAFVIKQLLEEEAVFNTFVDSTSPEISKEIIERAGMSKLEAQ